MRVAIGIVEKNGKLLLLRKKNSRGNALWRFPGGKVERGEKVVDAIIREVKEETGVLCRPLIQIAKRDWKSKCMKLIFYRCEYISGDAIVSEPEKFIDFKWATPEEAVELIGIKLKSQIKDFLWVVNYKDISSDDLSASFHYNEEINAKKSS